MIVSTSWKAVESCSWRWGSSMASEVTEEEIFGARRGIEGKERNLAPAFHAGQRHVLLHLVHEPFPVLYGALDVGERMLGIGAGQTDSPCGLNLS